MHIRIGLLLDLKYNQRFKNLTITNVAQFNGQMDGHINGCQTSAYHHTSAELKLTAEANVHISESKSIYIHFFPGTSTPIYIHMNAFEK